MYTKTFSLPFVCFTLFILSTICTRGQNLITFDDVHENGVGTTVPSGYNGLTWNNFWCFNAVLYTPTSPNGTNGYYYGMVSASNVVYDGLGNPAEIDSPGTNFNFLSVYLTGAWHSNLNVEVQGFRGATLMYDQIVVVAARAPTQFTFNYTDIDRVYFSSYGGDVAFNGYDGGNHFVMDNFAFEFIPEPSSLLLTALGGVFLVAFLRRKHFAAFPL